MSHVRRATLSSRGPARILQRFPLHYTAGENVRLDRPAHVRAASGLCWLDRKLAIIQDDAAFVALVDPRDLSVDSIALPMIHGMRQFDKSRANKHFKRDLEACFAVTLEGVPQLFAMGSGSSPEREFVLRVRAGSSGYEVEQLGAHSLYAMLRSRTDFAGSELNLEGAALRDGQLVLFQRGNGAPNGDSLPKNASTVLVFADLLRYLADPTQAPPALGNVIEHDLGNIEGVRLTFTDAAPGYARNLLFVASAEASPNAVDDGVVVGSALGVMGESGDCLLAELHNEAGEACRDKVEGITLDANDPGHAWLVVDPDDHQKPGSLLRVKLTDDLQQWR